MYDAVRWKVTQFQRLGGVSSSSRRMDQFKSRGMCLFGWDFQSVCWQISPLKRVFQKKNREIFGKPKFTNIPCWKSGPTNFQPKFGFLVTEEGFYFQKKCFTRNRRNPEKKTQIYKKIHPKSSNFRAVVPWNIVFLVAGNKSPRRFSGSA